jgi:acetyltransferase
MIKPRAVSGLVQVRPIRTDDRKELSRFYAGLSADSRYARFHAVSRGIPEGAADVLCGPDHEHREGLVAEIIRADVDGAGIVGHICVEPCEAGFEMAIAVADEWQRCGVGRSLLGAALDWAAYHGIARLRASMLSTNSAILGLIASLEFPIRLSAPSAGVITVTIDIGGALPKAA